MEALEDLEILGVLEVLEILEFLAYLEKVAAERWREESSNIKERCTNEEAEPPGDSFSPGPAAARRLQVDDDEEDELVKGWTSRPRPSRGRRRRQRRVSRGRSRDDARWSD